MARLENIQLRQRVRVTNREMELVGEVAKIVTLLNNLDDLFERPPDCLEESFGFDQALISWISSSKSNHRIDTLQTSKNSESSQPLIGGTNNPALCFRIATPLSDRGQVIRSLELLRKTPPFSIEEQDLLRQVANHIVPAVYNTGLHHSPFVKPTSYRRELRELPAPSSRRQVMQPDMRSQS